MRGFRNNKGFLLIDTLIAGLIITSSVAATMVLFRVGFENLQRANRANELSSKVAPAINLIKTLDLTKGSGTVGLGDGVVVKWQAKLILRAGRYIEDEPGRRDTTITGNEYLYQVNFSIISQGGTRDHEMNVYKHVRDDSTS
jgi:hypothetical protein